ncbi:MAG TPA: efflux transporter outer membrane subunit [Rhizomicrobium sp.]|jgi:NodT family efflux transporter outer membrane factor (OMF) lipoprotein
MFDSSASHLITKARLVALLATAALGGCTVGPDFQAPARPTEQTYAPQTAATIDPPAPGESGQRVAMGRPLQADWWKSLGSPELNETVEAALSHNWSLAAAQANLAKAQQIVKSARGGLYPQVDGAAGAERRAYGAEFLGPQAFTFPTFSAYTAGIGVSYDPDIFGGTHRQIELASADAEVSGEALNAARLAVSGGVVMTALQSAATRAQVAAVQDMIASDEKTLDLVRAARRTGVASEMDVMTAQSQLDRDQAMLPPLHQRLEAAQDALAVLVGRSPANWSAPALDLDRLTLPEELPLALPSELVRARPDIRAAEARLHAASAEVGVATADLYPRFNLSAAVAGEGLMSGPAGTAWSLVAGMTAPIFHGGALTARRKAAEQAYQASFDDYQQTVLAAFQQVADTLHGLANTADSVRAERQALESASAALRLTRLGYGAGNTGIVQVLDAQRQQQLAQLSLIEARAQRHALTVDLFLATGGGLMEAGADGSNTTTARAASGQDRDHS